MLPDRLGDEVSFVEEVSVEEALGHPRDLLNTGA
jgi:hypothetical protein